MEEVKNTNEKKSFFKKLGAAIRAHKGRTIAIAVTAFLLICAIVAISLLSVLVFNRFATGYVPTDAQLAAVRGQYSRVVIIGVDGAGAYPGEMLDEDPDLLPNFGKLFNVEKGIDTANGTHLNASVTYSGIAVYPTISAQNWVSMFHGVRPFYHGVTGDASNSDLENGKQANSEYPSFVKVVLDAYPESRVISSCTWKAINNGAIEKELDRVDRYIATPEQLYMIANDLLEDGKPIITDVDLIDKIKEVTAFDGYADVDYSLSDALTVQRVIDATTTPEGKEKYKIAYMHLNQVDSAGHSFGYNKQPYRRALSRVDVLIGKLYAAYEAANMLDDTLFIFCTDHGHRYAQDGTGHGGNSDVEVKVTFAITGKTVKSGKPGKYVNTDLAPIVAYALGVKASKKWQGRVPYNMFTALG